MKPYLFSIIVPTYNRSDEVIDLIHSFNDQIFPHDLFEILLIDDGSTDDTEKKVTELKSQSGFKIRFFQRNHECPGPARNYGMSQAKGEYFLFIDSDCIADESWLSNLARAVEAQKPDAFGGPDSVLNSFTPLQKAIDYAMTSFITTGGMRGHSRKKLAKFYPRSFNMGIHLSIYDKLGGMGDLRHGQDLEFSRRIVASGAKVISVPDAVVYHKRRTSLRKFFRQMFNWGVARINLTMLDRGILEPLHFIPAVGALGFTLLLLLSLFNWFIFKIWVGCLGFALLIMLYIFFDSFSRYKDIQTSLLAPFVSVIQVFGYGYGFTINYIRRMILGKGEFTGFVKKYYK